MHECVIIIPSFVHYVALVHEGTTLMVTVNGGIMHEPKVSCAVTICK